MARQIYFAREIGEIIRSTVKPRILVLGAGKMLEASDALFSSHLHHAEFVALEPDPAQARSLRRQYGQCRLKLEAYGWDEFASFAYQSDPFDLIYSVSWLDSTDDEQALRWLSIATEILRPGGRILAANLAPCSLDAGCMEACWNWQPFHRSEEQLAQLVIQLKQPHVRGHAVFRDDSGASAYLEIHAL